MNIIQLLHQECKTKKTTQVTSKTSKISPMVQTSFARSPFTQLLFVVLFLIKVGNLPIYFKNPTNKKRHL